jgi:hypothetical protein
MSKRAQIRDALLSKGEAAARDLAEKLNISASTTNAYISHFLKHGKGGAKRERSTLEGVAKLVEGNAKRSGGKLRAINSVFSDELAVGVEVFDVGEPQRDGVIMKLGPEVSAVSWAGAPTLYVSNAFLRPYKKDPKERERQINAALADLREMRVARVQTWISERRIPRGAKISDRAIWDFIRTKWPHLSRDDADKIYQECE